MLNDIMALMVAAILIEAVIHVIFSVEGLNLLLKKIPYFPVQVIFSLTLGIVVCYHLSLDVFNLLIPTTPVSSLGMVITGIIISRGSNYVHDILKSITEATSDKKLTDNTANPVPTDLTN